ncbi:YcxB family protein [Chitinimonas sp. BJB300]|uniref:YcxB family protein n=1 Tax=Chitinimonas sp. BJB300 TaxID=1559339 RepID=UPI000C11326C|nr:YcxB family protein [Chitinimonas sp. BJB300]PHV09602.1 hypothetical protein CSQ89_20825 [Chitinimonas sp. BJB300]TSJ84590.1 YcxB family protein [Chitinimonas sp. BJB300]
MHATFTLSESDFVALNNAVNRRLKAVSRANSKLFLPNFVVSVTMGVAIASYLALYRKYPFIATELSFVAGAFAVSTLFIVGNSVYKRSLCRRAMLSRNSWFLSRQDVELTENGFHWSGASSSAEYIWGAFCYFDEDKTNLYLFLDNAQAVVLPKKALGTPEQVEKVKSWLHP